MHGRFVKPVEDGEVRRHVVRRELRVRHGQAVSGGCHTLQARCRRAHRVVWLEYRLFWIQDQSSISGQAGCEQSPLLSSHGRCAGQFCIRWNA